MIYTNGTTTSGTSDDLTLYHNPITPANLMSYLDPAVQDPATHIYTVMVASGDTAGQGTDMMMAAQLDPSSSNTTITIDSTSTSLDMTADLHSLQPFQVPTGNANLLIDWGGMDNKLNAMGHPFIATNITHALVASYDQTPTELEQRQNFLNLQTIATGMWQSDVESGTSISLSAFTDSNGNAFGGIDATHTWIIALECGTCRNPAPWYITVLKPCAS